MTPLLLPSSPLPQLLHRESILLRARRLGRVANAASNGNSSGDSSPAAADASTTSSSSDSKAAGIKNRLRARNQARRVQLDAPPEMVVTPKKKAPAAAPRKEKQRAPKKWEEMSLAEKALELYVGEKGLLFWLNKFAYASIFIMVGAWILFRFVGPSLGIYQLDAPPLPPTAVFGS
ncbi:hypothetical protein QOZ80_6BG0504420 [Eleusine coracana subsp. coracana]|nr:hypothetical protein QOZ80_6BG0504420 [Eleusine coracana subsp. coracana]